MQKGRKQILENQFLDNIEVLKYAVKTENNVTEGFIQGIIYGMIGYALRCEDITLEEYKVYQKRMEIILLQRKK